MISMFPLQESRGAIGGVFPQAGMDSRPKAPVAEGDTSALLTGEPTGLVPGGAGDKDGYHPRLHGESVLDDEDAPAPDFDPAVKIEPDGFGVDPVFLDQDAGGQRVLGIVLEDRDDGLDLKTGCCGRGSLILKPNFVIR